MKKTEIEFGDRDALITGKERALAVSAASGADLQGLGGGGCALSRGDVEAVADIPVILDVGILDPEPLDIGLGGVEVGRFGADALAPAAPERVERLGIRVRGDLEIPAAEGFTAR